MASQQLDGSVDDWGPDVVDLPAVEPFDSFYRREMPGLVALARPLTGARHAEDVAQDAMVTAYDRWDAVALYDSPGAWVRQVCANRAVSLLRRRGAETRALLRLGNRAEPPTPPALSEDTETFWSEVRRLPRRQAQCLALFYVYDLGVVEIARTLGCSEGSVKVHLSRGRATIARRLDTSVEEWQ